MYTFCDTTIQLLDTYPRETFPFVRKEACMYENFDSRGVFNQEKK